MVALEAMVHVVVVSAYIVEFYWFWGYFLSTVVQGNFLVIQVDFGTGEVV